MSRRSPSRSSPSAYCRCVLHVAAKNSTTCNLKKAFKVGTSCKNPYAICTASTKRKGAVSCGQSYNYRTLPRAELDAFAALHGIDPRKYRNKQSLIAVLEQKVSREKQHKRSPPRGG